MLSAYTCTRSNDYFGSLSCVSVTNPQHFYIKVLNTYGYKTTLIKTGIIIIIIM